MSDTLINEDLHTRIDGKRMIQTSLSAWAIRQKSTGYFLPAKKR